MSEPIPDDDLNVPVASSEPSTRKAVQNDVTAAFTRSDKSIDVIRGSGTPVSEDSDSTDE